MKIEFLTVCLIMYDHSHNELFKDRVSSWPQIHAYPIRTVKLWDIKLANAPFSFWLLFLLLVMAVTLSPSHSHIITRGRLCLFMSQYTHESTYIKIVKKKKKRNCFFFLFSVIIALLFGFMHYLHYNVEIRMLNILGPKMIMN